MNLKMYLTSFGIDLNGVRYDLADSVSVSAEYPERNRLTRGADGQNPVGIPYKENTRQPKRWTITTIEIQRELYLVLLEAYKRMTRMEVFGVDRDTGTNVMMRNAILSNEPAQLTIDDSPDSMNVELEFESFDVKAVLK